MSGSYYIHDYTLTSALGSGLAATRQAFATGQGGLSNAPWPDSSIPCFLGRVDGLEGVAVAPGRESRNNRLIERALTQDGFVEAGMALRNRYGPDRCGIAIGTSTSSLDRTELAYRTADSSSRFEPAYLQPRVHNPHGPGDYVAERLEITGPCLTLSAACASSAKVFATAKRWLDLDLVDAVVVGGADSLCLSVIYGFNSLQLVAEDPCRPYAPDRQGISLGEAAGFAIVSREESDLRLLGVGESCDAHHMSSAHPEGLGAQLAIEGALADAGLTVAEVDYVNLHGTGTKANDAIEGIVCGRLLQEGTLVSATKGWTGHTLGAAGIVESVVCLEALATGLVPGTLNTQTHEAPFDLMLDNQAVRIDTALTNSFGFGGTNCTLVFGRP